LLHNNNELKKYIMKFLTINEKINVRSNMDFDLRRDNNCVKHCYNIAQGHKNNPKSMYFEGCLYYSVMPINTQLQLLRNRNFQRSFA
jgi:hypothetical protein